MAIAEPPSADTIRREGMAAEMRRHALMVSLLSDPETVSSLQQALAEERKGLAESVTLDELRAKYGTNRAGKA